MLPRRQLLTLHHYELVRGPVATRSKSDMRPGVILNVSKHKRSYANYLFLAGQNKMLEELNF